jgi:phage portal protein BeeE
MFKGIGMSQDGINGLSPISMHRETIGHAIVAAEHGAKVLAKGAKKCNGTPKMPPAISAL